MAIVKPTRSELLVLNKKIKLAIFGHSLLKRKRDGLIKEFFNILKKAKEMKSELTENYKLAVETTDLARAMDGSAAVKSAALAIKHEAEVDVKTRGIMGINVPEVRSEHRVRNINERGYGLIGTSGYIDDASESYETVLKNIIIAAEIETTLKKLLIEVDKTKRRVNALEFTVIPNMEDQAKFIELRLEEMEREDIFRLKRIKKSSNKTAS